MVLVSLVKIDDEVAMPVPLALLREAGLRENDVVELTVSDGRLIIERPWPKAGLEEDAASNLNHR